MDKFLFSKTKKQKSQGVQSQSTARINAYENTQRTFIILHCKCNADIWSRSWAVQGLLRFLLGTTPAARRLRRGAKKRDETQHREHETSKRTHHLMNARQNAIVSFLILVLAVFFVFLSREVCDTSI